MKTSTKVLGESGRYVSDAAQREWRRVSSLTVILIGLLGLVEGFVLASFIPRALLPPWAKTTLLIGVFPALYALWKWGNRKMDDIDKRHRAYQRGADGEDQVARVLARFPDDFHVIHDLATPFGNVDHVVIGPTGVFILDAKSWRGVVTGDGKGELLVNGRPTDKQNIRPFVGRMLSIRDKVRTLAPGLDPYYQAVFVFTSARVEAKWGTTGNVHCIRDEQLFDYIVEKKFGPRLRPDDVRILAQAFLALAHMDRDFTERSGVPDGSVRGPTPVLASASKRASA